VSLVLSRWLRLVVRLGFAWVLCGGGGCGDGWGKGEGEGEDGGRGLVKSRSKHAPVQQVRC
jgi:hypothetical protein